MSADAERGSLLRWAEATRRSLAVLPPRSPWLVSLLFVALLTGWRWHSTRLSEIERRLVGVWKDDAEGVWTFQANGTLRVRGSNLGFDVPLRYGNFSYTPPVMDYDWKVRGNFLILRMHSSPLPAATSVLTKLWSWVSQLRFPTITRMQFLVKDQQEFVLRTLDGSPWKHQPVFLQPTDFPWPSPTQQRLHVAEANWWNRVRVGKVNEPDF